MGAHGTAPPRRRGVRRILAALVGVAFSLVLVELACLLAVEGQWLAARVPSYSVAGSRNTFWGDVSPEFGAWHAPNAAYRHHKACFDVTYHSNSYGARDAERPRVSDVPRVAVLGDSFMEGYGVEVSERLSNVLELRLGVPFLNFGTSGNAGSTHAYALYRSLAQHFEHDVVLCSILPENDFDDDLPQDGRYLPYWAGTAPYYELRFPIPAVSESSWARVEASTGFDLGATLRDFTYTQNVADLLYSAHKHQRMRDRIEGDSSVTASRFHRFSVAEFDRLRHSHECIARLAAPRQVVLFTIPRPVDLAAHRETGRSPLDEALQAWAATVPNVTFVPLLGEMLRASGGDPARHFLRCDAHWSPAGHRAAAEVLERHLVAALRAAQARSRVTAGARPPESR